VTPTRTASRLRSVSPPDHDVIVIGSGIIGVTIAWKASKAGRRVLLLDRDEPGMGCSYGNAAHFATEQIFPLANLENLKKLPGYMFSANSPLTFKKSSLYHLIPWGWRFLMACREPAFRRGVEALSALNIRSLKDWTGLLEEVGAIDLLHRPGTLQLAETRKGARELEVLQRQLEGYGVRSRLLQRPEVLALTGDLPNGACAGLHFPDTAYCDDPHQFLLKVFNACMEKQVAFLRQDVRAVVPGQHGEVAVHCDGETLTARSVVIACGVHSKPLVERFGYKVPLIAERGYHLLLPRAGVNLALPITLHERQFIMTPMSGAVRLAGTVEFARTEDSPTMARADMLLEQAREVFPSLDDTGKTRWMGCRPTLPDYVPAMDRLDCNAEVYVSFGHSHLGLTQAATSANLIVDLMSGRQPELDPAPYRADRV
jgi:glycine/D-amino acid oxidase-like deaminating enzyme